jgi:hypothetical protein
MYNKNKKTYNHVESSLTFKLFSKIHTEKLKFKLFSFNFQLLLKPRKTTHFQFFQRKKKMQLGIAVFFKTRKFNEKILKIQLLSKI